MLRTNSGFTHQTVDKKLFFPPPKGENSPFRKWKNRWISWFCYSSQVCLCGQAAAQIPDLCISRTQKNGQPKPSVSSFCKRSIPVLGSDFILHDVALLELDAIEIVHSARSFRPTPIKNAVRNTRNDQRSKDENSGHIQHPFWSENHSFFFGAARLFFAPSVLIL